MFQLDEILDALSDPVVLRYIIGGIIALVVIIICYVIHHKLSK
ncbi:MAG: hypothetical protein ACFE8B_05260 [Candidatus Hermodarchaeota archaeon]